MIYDELYDIRSVLPAVWMGKVGAVSVSRVTQYVTEKQFGLVMTHAKDGLSVLQSEVM